MRKAFWADHTLRENEGVDVTEKEPLVVTIDGPSASGKSSVSRALAEKLNWPWVSTGAFYRGLAFVAQLEGVDLDNETELIQLIASDKWKIKLDLQRTKVFYQAKEVTDKIYLEEAGAAASQISKHPELRKNLLQKQRDCALSQPGLIAEGRDCGSVVFPNAKSKIYLTARSEDRALRRAQEEGLGVEETQAAQKLRDAQDSQRKAAPLQVPEGAHVVDTSEMDLAQVIARVSELVEADLAE